MKLKLIYFLLMILSCSTSGCISDKDPDGPTLTTGDYLPDFSVELNTGTIISTQTLRGKVAVIVFFNTGCGDCQKELPVIQQLWNEFRENEKVEICLIAREEAKDEIEEYWKENNLSMPYSPQDNRDVYSLFAPSVIPRIYVANPKGMITAAYGDQDMPSLDDLILDIQNCL